MIGVTPVTKTGFFGAIVNERFLEFGHEGIRRYDLLRWNLLATKNRRSRTKIQQIRDRLVAPYNNIPQYIYYKNVGERNSVLCRNKYGINCSAFLEAYTRYLHQLQVGQG